MSCTEDMQIMNMTVKKTHVKVMFGFAALFTNNQTNVQPRDINEYPPY